MIEIPIVLILPVELYVTAKHKCLAFNLAQSVLFFKENMPGAKLLALAELYGCAAQAIAIFLSISRLSML